MRCFVTGGTGFIGSHLVRELLEQKHEIVGITGNQTENPAPAGVKLFEPGLYGCDWGGVPEFDTMFHLAANNNTMEKDPNKMIYDNTTWLQRLVIDSYEKGCRRFIMASSTAIYGNYARLDGPMDEDHRISHQQLSPYAHSKALAEHTLERVALDGLDRVAFRFSNIFGPGEAHKGRRASMVYQLTKANLEELPIMLFKSGEQMREWLYVADLVRLLMVAGTTRSLRYPYNVYNAGSGYPVTFNFLLRAIHRETAKPHRISLVEPPPNYQAYVHTDIMKAKRELNWSPWFGLEDGIREMLKKEPTLQWKELSKPPKEEV